MKLAITAGGTGGHIYPALSVLEVLRQRHAEDLEARFFGPDDRGERQLVEPSGLAFEVVPSAAIRGRGPIGLARSASRLLRGTVTAWRRLRAFGPDVVFSTGGYASFPCSLGARLLRRPLIVYLPDVSPGWAVRAEARLATRLATTAEAALGHLPRDKTVVTGYPVRPAFFRETKETAREALELPATGQVLLVAGASQGARAINRAVFAALAELCRVATVIHVTGRIDEGEALGLRERLGQQGARYHPAAFREDLPLAMLAADLAVMRAGASVLGELPAAGLPAVLVPGTYAGGHQHDNARWLADAGAAVILEEGRLDGLAATVVALLEDATRLVEMQGAAKALAKPLAATAIAEMVEEVARR